MNINIDTLVTLLIILGGITFFIVKEFRTMSRKERSEAKEDFKSKDFLFTVGLLLIGFIFALPGSLFAFNIVKLLGILIMVIAGVNILVGAWKQSKLNSIFLALLIIVTILILL